MLWGLRHADVVKISDEETEFLFSLAPEESAKHIINSFGVRLVYVTCGAEGCFTGRRRPPALSRRSAA